jgi:drug/metabolite transporter (DMT)-like permease
MNPAGRSPSLARSAAWTLALALALVYLSWGTTYIAIRTGVQTLPPGMFGGVRVMLAGVVLLGYLAARGQLTLPAGRELVWVWLAGGLMFVGGNGLLTLALKDRAMASSVAAVLVATTPLWLALLETIWPRGERLTALGWAGVFLGLVGVALIKSRELRDPWESLRDRGPFLVLGSAWCWALGSVVHRHHRGRTPHLSNAALQMFLGGGSMTVLALLVGEGAELRQEQLTTQAVIAFFYLLVVGSLIGFVAFTWVLSHTSAALAGTYAYVNPVVALLVGWLVDGDQIGGRMVGGMVIILLGVALVRLFPPLTPQETLPSARGRYSFPQALTRADCDTERGVCPSADGPAR